MQCWETEKWWWFITRWRMEKNSRDQAMLCQIIENEHNLTTQSTQLFATTGNVSCDDAKIVLTSTTLKPNLLSHWPAFNSYARQQSICPWMTTYLLRRGWSNIHFRDSKFIFIWESGTHQIKFSSLTVLDYDFAVAFVLFIGSVINQQILLHLSLTNQ